MLRGLALALRVAPRQVALQMAMQVAPRRVAPLIPVVLGDPLCHIAVVLVDSVEAVSVVVVHPMVCRSWMWHAW